MIKFIFSTPPNPQEHAENQYMTGGQADFNFIIFEGSLPTSRCIQNDQ